MEVGWIRGTILLQVEAEKHIQMGLADLLVIWKRKSFIYNVLQIFTSIFAMAYNHDCHSVRASNKV